MIKHLKTSLCIFVFFQKKNAHSWSMFALYYLTNRKIKLDSNNIYQREMKKFKIWILFSMRKILITKKCFKEKRKENKPIINYNLDKIIN